MPSAPGESESVNMAPEQKDRPDEEEDMHDEPISAEQPLQPNEQIQYYGGMNGGLGQRKRHANCSRLFCD